MPEDSRPYQEALLFADYLDSHHESILDRWRETIADDTRIVSSESLDVKELLDHLPEILLDLSKLMRLSKSAQNWQDLEGDAETHGKERWSQGYALGEVLLEIDRFRKILLFDVMRAFAAQNPDIELETHLRISAILFDFSQELIVGSVEEFTEAKNAELRAANNEVTRTNQRLQQLNNQLRVESEKVRELSLKDPLTKLANRRHLDTHMTMEVDLCKRYGESMTVIMCDLDHFKRINDSYGHDVGDEVLKVVATHLEYHSRASDLVARYGGEEFLLVLPKTSIDTALALAERIRTSLLDLQVLPVTEQFSGSLGLAQWREGESPDQLIARADKAMYRAKANGRNRIDVSPSDQA